jgi:hypothetical protein
MQNLAFCTCLTNLSEVTLPIRQKLQEISKKYDRINCRKNSAVVNLNRDKKGQLKGWNRKQDMKESKEGLKKRKG